MQCPGLEVVEIRHVSLSALKDVLLEALLGN
jgi:hypothetical protein